MFTMSKMMFPSLRICTALYLLTTPVQLVHCEEECGLWIGPSPIKAAFEHGFGFGMFTGRHIPRGSSLPAEPLVPIYDADLGHSPLREYVWEPQRPSDNALALESSGGVMVFAPGLAAIAPCTTTNFNLARGDALGYENWGAHRAGGPEVGASSYHSAVFVAVRDIRPGEELVVNCSDDSFDPDALSMQDSHRELTEAGGMRMCVDDTIEQRKSPIHGKGSFARRDIPPDTVLVSTPMAPVYRDQLDMEVRGKDEKQLLLNYCYGHPDSVLLWLPHGPSANAINHSQEPNARIRWHVPPPSSPDGDLSPRQRYHHPELLDVPAEEVVRTHGKAMVMDVVSTRTVRRGEEIVIDYGTSWVAAWEGHLKRWPAVVANGEDAAYVPAHGYNIHHGAEDVRTLMEQHRDPYPHNLQTACYFEVDWLDIDDDEEGPEDVLTFESWNNQENHRNCLLPCAVVERKEREGDSTLYMAKLIDTYSDNVAIDWMCHIYVKYEYFYTDIPREGIIFVDRPYSSDVWLPDAFRQPIGLPDAMVPDVWKKRNVRRRPGAPVESADEIDRETFKRKVVTKKQDTLDAIRIKVDASVRADL